MNRTISCLAAATFVALAATGAAPADPKAADDGKASGAAAKTAAFERALAPFRLELLDLAFAAASAFPLNPHVKNRGRAQEDVVVAELELGRPRRALAGIEQIVGWRKGLGYANYAFYCATHGDEAQARNYMHQATEIAQSHRAEADAQDWECDRIQTTVAKTLAWLGRPNEAAQLTRGAEVFEVTKVEAVKAMLIDDAGFDAEWKSLCTTLEKGSFDEKKSAIEIGAQLFNRFYDQRERRLEIEKRIKDSWSRLPLMIRIDALLEMSGFALDHHDTGAAVSLLEDAQAIVQGASWLPRDRIPLQGRLALARVRVGDAEGARREADDAFASYAAERANITDIHRADTLRPLAEAYHALGDEAKARSTYTQAVEDGTVNPNSRPRVDDLVATCLSMARTSFDPGVELMAKLHAIRDHLGPPW